MSIDTSTLEALKLHLDSNGAQAFHGDLESILPEIVAELIDRRGDEEDAVSDLHDTLDDILEICEQARTQIGGKHDIDLPEFVYAEFDRIAAVVTAEK